MKIMLLSETRRNLDEWWWRRDGTGATGVPMWHSAGRNDRCPAKDTYCSSALAIVRRPLRPNTKYIIYPSLALLTISTQSLISTRMGRVEEFLMM